MNFSVCKSLLSKPREIVKGKEAWHAAVHAITKGQTWLSDWTTANHVWAYKYVFTTIVASQVVLVAKYPPDNVGDVRDVGSIPGSGRSPGAGHGNPLQYSCLQNPVNRGAWQATVHRSQRVGHDWRALAHTYS